MITYTCSYQFGGRRHVIHIRAQDWTDASRRLRAIGMTAQVDGELIAEIPLERPDGWLTQLRCWIGHARPGR